MTGLRAVLAGWMEGWFGDHSPAALAVRAQQVAVLSRGTPTMALGNLFNAALVMLVVGRHLPWPMVTGWGLLIGVGALHRLYLWWRNRGREHTRPVRRRALRRAVLWSGLIGAIWGAAGFAVPMLAPAGDLGELNFLAFAIGGQAAAAATWLAPLFPAFLAYLLASMGPLVLGFALLGSLPGVGMALMLVAYAAVLTHFNRQAGRTFRARVLEGLERERLLEALRIAHGQVEAQVRARTAELEATNARLSAEVTERARAERSVRDQQALLGSVIDAIPMRISVKDRDGNRLVANRLMRETFGLTPGDPLPPAHALPLVEPAEHERVRRDEQRVLAGEVITRERLRRQPNGLEEWLQVVWAPVRDLDEQIIGSVVVTADITPRKLWELELASFFDLSQDIHAILDVGGRIRRANRALESILEITLDRLPDGMLLDLVHEDDQPLLRQAFQRLSAYEIVRDLQLRFRRADGQYRWLSWRATRDRETGLVFAVGRDVTDARLAEEQLHSSQRLLQGVFDTVPSWVFVKDVQGHYLMVNRAMAGYFGCTPAEFVGRTFGDFTGRAQEWTITSDEADQLVLAGRREVGTYAVGPGSKSDRRPLLLNVIKLPLHDEAGNVVGIVGTAVDTTEQARLEGQLRQSQKMEAVGQLAGGVAHDFNNLLQIMLGYSQMALRSLDDRERVRQNLLQVVQSAERAAAITQRLLAFSRREVHQQRRLDVNAGVEELFDMVQHLISGRTEVRLELGALTRGVEADAGQLQQALINLCVNARDAMPGGGEIAIHTEERRFEQPFAAYHGDAPAGDYIRIQVRDTGCGMPPEVLERIFEPFFTTKAVGHGTGLGLSMVYGFAEESGGYLQVESTVGQGSAISLNLPAVTLTDPEEPAAAKAAGAGQGRCILVAEDEEPVRRLLVALLEAEGYEVLDARDGEEAEQIFAGHAAHIAMAVLDVVMPKRSGADVLETIRARRPHLPVLFSTGYADRHLDAAELHGEQVPIIRKPYNPEELLAAVQHGLQAHPVQP